MYRPLKYWVEALESLDVRLESLDTRPESLETEAEFSALPSCLSSSSSSWLYDLWRLSLRVEEVRTGRKVDSSSSSFISTQSHHPLTQYLHITAIYEEYSYLYWWLLSSGGLTADLWRLFLAHSSSAPPAAACSQMQVFLVEASSSCCGGFY